MEWSCGKLAVITPDAVRAWLEQGAPGSHWKLYRGCGMPADVVPGKAPGHELVLDIRLVFDGALLVNDPSQFRKQTKQERGVGHAMVRRRDGRYFLPGSSVRGALRAQTRKIWQTLSDGKDGDRNGWKGAIEAKRSHEQKKLHALDRMWGAPGWRAPIHVPDFELSKEMQTRRQEFVAVDRFTGGAADEKKFSADALYGPEFRGTVRVALDAWERAATGPWALLLLVFLLRDLQEGDVRFGLGSGKGYGACTAEIQIRTGTQGNTEFEALLSGVLGRNQAALNDPVLETLERELNAELEKSAA
jgi:CRISPR/Cas system CSM-associated protein Csm3 (group 7 of RAMP superfamily)